MNSHTLFAKFWTLYRETIFILLHMVRGNVITTLVEEGELFPFQMDITEKDERNGDSQCCHFSYPQQFAGATPYTLLSLDK